MPLSITSDLIVLIDGEYRCDDTLLYGYRPIRLRGWVSPLWRVISCPLFFAGYEAHEGEGQPTLTILVIYASLNDMYQQVGLYGFFVVNTL